MRQVPDWTSYFLDLARTTASRSKDPKTQVGAVIVNDDGRIIAQGYNGMVAGAFDTANGWAAKDRLVIHAEENAIANAARCGASTLGATIYVTIAPCHRCMRLIAASGIRHVVFDNQATQARLEEKPERGDSHHLSFELALRANITWSAK